MDPMGYWFELVWSVFLLISCQDLMEKILDHFEIDTKLAILGVGFPLHKPYPYSLYR